MSGPTETAAGAKKRKKAVYFVGGSVAGDVPIPPHFRGILKVQRDSPKGTLQTVDGERAASAEYVVKYQRKLVGSFPSLRAAALAYDFRILTLRREAATAGSVSILPSRGPALNFADAEGLFEAELKAGRNPEHSVLDLADDPALAHGAVSPIAPRPTRQAVRSWRRTDRRRASDTCAV